MLVPHYANKRIEPGLQRSFNIGYLFLQQIYYDLNLPGICARIKKKHRFSYDLDSILSRLVYGRILYPSSKRTCCEESKKFLEQPEFQLHQVYRALSVLAEESDFIQAGLYESSKRLMTRKTGILYYDCTNYFFETETAEGLRQYGASKEHRPNPIVQMGLFMDQAGMPLAFCITPGNTNEQTTLVPLESRLIKDFSVSRFIVCTDAGLSSEANRRFNNFGGRCFVTTQSIKKLKKTEQEECLAPTGWKLCGSDHKTLYDIGNLEDTEENKEKVFFKEIFVEDYDEEREIYLNQTRIITYSLKYRNYQRSIRNQQIERAMKALASNTGKVTAPRQTDYKRFIRKTAFTGDGEIARKSQYTLDQDAIEKEERYDGFYAVITNLEDGAEDIIRISQRRWEIEESFRIMKTEFDARPVYLSRDDRIKAHFLTCFISLMIYRILEKKVEERFSCHRLIQTLQGMEVTRHGDYGYTPNYVRDEVTDALHEAGGFQTDYELIRPRKMKGILRLTKE